MLSLDTSYQTADNSQGQRFFIESYDGIEFTVFEHDSRALVGSISTISAEELTEEVGKLIESHSTV